ncbi:MULTISPECIES: class I SAM-dependent methyltransferase [Eubacteriales]|uniref:Methyltransferase domain-containing protein n=1 Tax=Bittarella massiliensis (ex Durand et al. 2017) TaxID=1720313 RepID=A0AAQ1MEG8_9FIRM|nr:MULTISPECIES: class I SAM-dependent methyltransferase [Eubacteriales]MZL70800.1 methyltransferase domain-containing protein [Bittarella massiliensis (ex Durand et al. 2017)]MZL81531.1 methyltransferase domain-containing protein [Bittarella massiliensis (ex Durand et al. 2017)]SHG31184.1 Methyltransferase domain-containing protein [Bittarella massiliensis (ex Durand et al. 2017)]
MNHRQLLHFAGDPPPLYQPSTAPFWDDEHISKGMLEAHLTPDRDGASRKHSFIRSSAEWIAALCRSRDAVDLLDLGCGPGLYAERFCLAGLRVTGVDLSRRSVAYAAESAARQGLAIDYRCQNYLRLPFEAAFDAAVLIYCDFGVLSPKDRQVLLANVRRALRPGGLLVLDVFSHRQLRHFTEGRSVSFLQEGYWSPLPHLCLQNNVYYAETDNTLEQSVIVTEGDCRCYNLWNQLYTAQSLQDELAAGGFGEIQLFDRVDGSPFTDRADTLCAVALSR